MTKATPIARSRELVLVASIGVLALLLRLYQLSGKSLWLDEVSTARAAHANTLGEVVAQTQAYVNQMPFFYFFTWFLRPFGDGEFILRLPAVVAGVLTVLVVYVLAKSLYGVRAALVASLLTAVLPYAVWYSQEARNYTLLMFLTTTQMYFAYRCVKHRRLVDWFGLAALTTLNLYTHYLAFLATAAVVVYVSLALLTELLSGTSIRARVTAVSALFVIALAAAIVPWRPALRVVLPQSKLHPLEAMAVLIALLGVVVVLGFLLRGRLLQIGHAKPQVTRQIALAAGAAGLVVLAYLPWLPTFRAVFTRTDLESIHLGHSLGFNDVVDLLARLDLSGLLIAALGLGLVALLVEFRRWPSEATLLLAWLAVPTLLFLRSSGPDVVAIDRRYLAFLIPAALIAIGVGVDWGARVFELMVERVKSKNWPNVPRPATLATLVLVALLLIQTLPALAASYRTPKDDWRAAAEHIASASPPGSVVLAVGDYTDWTVLCLDYYFHRLKAPIQVIDGRLVNADVAAQLASGTSTVWGAVVFPSLDQQALLERPSDVNTEFVDVTGHIHVVRAAAGGLSAMDQARTLLRWEAAVMPQFGALAKVLDLYSGNAQLGPNLLPDPAAAGWSVQPGVHVEAGSLTFAPSAATGELNATGSVAVQPGDIYVVSFEWRNAALNGSQKVFVSVFDEKGSTVSIFPTGDGYPCARSDTWTRSYFAFDAPAGAALVAVVLRVNGSGTAEFRNVQLASVV